MSHGRSGIDTTALDETGTLTQGRPEVTDLLPVSGTDPQELLRLDASLKTDSEHPLAVAVVRQAQREGLDLRLCCLNSLRGMWRAGVARGMRKCSFEERS